MSRSSELDHYIGGAWTRSTGAEYLRVVDPATAELLAHVPAGTREDTARAVAAAASAYPGWRRTPPEERIQYLFKLKQLLERDIEELARICTMENGKTLAESRAELRRAIENVEVACGIPTLMQGYNLEDVATGIDEIMIRQPLGVTAAVTPFNFPAMIPFWFLPYAIGCGNTFILKPSEKVPLTAQRIFQILEELLLPAGVVNLVHGGKIAVETLLQHPQVRAISFVGSTAGRETDLRASGASREARAMPGRREKSRAGSAGCGYAHRDAHHRRQRLWVCGPALPGGVGGGNRRRSARKVHHGNHGDGQRDSYGERSR